MPFWERWFRKEIDVPPKVIEGADRQYEQCEMYWHMFHAFSVGDKNYIVLRAEMLEAMLGCEFLIDEQGAHAMNVKEDA